MINIQDIPDKSPLIDAAMEENLHTVFGKMESPVLVRAIVDLSDKKSKEQATFLKAVTSLSELLSLELYAPEEAGEVSELNAEYLPVTGLYKDGKYAGIAYHGVPGGQEMNSFVLGIYNLSGPGQELDKRTKKAIDKLKKPVNIKICVSLACHHCPKVVAVCQQIAANSDLVEAEMIDANLYKTLIDRYKIERVPLVVINDEEAHVGPKTITEILNLIK